jgi:hypothetical protein
MTGSPIRDAVRDVLVDSVRQINGAVADGIKDAIIPTIVNAINAVLWIVSAVLVVLILLPVFKRR